MKYNSPDTSIKYRLKVDNSLGTTMGTYNPVSHQIKVNIKGHKGDTAELASTVKHELLHRNYPDMLEKSVYKNSRKTKMPLAEQVGYLSKLPSNKLLLAMKKLNKLV